jgi:hypothetical protein
MKVFCRSSVIRFCCLLLAFLAVSCGRERRESGATVVPVQGLTYGSLSLAGEADRCAALVQFIAQFSAQYAPGIYRDAECTTEPEFSRNKVKFTVRNPANQDSIVATGVANRITGAAPAFVLCQVPQPNDQGATSCSGVQADASADGVPGRFRTNAYRLHDLYYSLGDFIVR